MLNNRGKKNMDKKLGDISINPKLKEQLMNENVAEFKEKVIMNNSNKDITKGIFGIIVIIVVFIILFIISRILNNNQERILNNSVNELASKSIINTNFIDEKVKNTGDYKVVADTIKEFLSKYSNYMKEIQNDLEQEQVMISTLLLDNNSQNDVPNFENSFKLINESKLKFDNDIENIKLLCSEESIMKLIENKKLSSDYIELYKKYFFGESKLKELIEKDSSMLFNTKNMVDNTYNGLIKLFKFLVDNQGKWKNNNGNIVFDDFALMAQFIALKANI